MDISAPSGRHAARSASRLGRHFGERRAAARLLGRAVPGRVRRVRSLVLVVVASVVVVLGALPGLTLAAAASAAGSSRLSAITEMPSRMSSLRMGPTGKPMTAAQDKARLKGSSPGGDRGVGQRRADGRAGG